MKHLGMTIELNPNWDKITCLAFGLYSSPAEYSTMWHIVLDLKSVTFQPESHERSTHPQRHVTFALTGKKKPVYPVHSPERDEDGDDKRLVQPSELVKERRESAAERRTPAHLQKRQGPPVWRDPSATLDQDVSGNLRERSKEVSILGKNPDGEALRKVMNKLLDERNSRDPHLKHYHMPTSQLKKRTTHLDLPGKIYDLYQHVVKTCSFCNSTKPRYDRSRVSGLRAEEFGDLLFLDHGSTKIGDKTFRFFDYFGWSPLEFISKLHEWLNGHVSDDSEGDLCRCGFPSSTWFAGILSKA